MKFEQALEQFLQYLEENDRSAKTLYGYKRDLCRFQAYYESKYNMEWLIEDTMPSDIEAYLRMLHEDQGLQPASRSRILNCMKSFYSYCHNRELCPKNPTVSVKTIRYHVPDRAYLTAEEYERFVKAIEHPIIRLATETMWYTGIRISELVQLSVADVKLDEGTLHVLGKGLKHRHIPLHPKLQSGLEQYRLEHRANAEPWERFFATQGSGALSASYFTKQLHETTTKLGWTKTVTAHILRHSFVTQLMDNGVHMFVIQKLAGHDDIRTTQKYAHASFTQMRPAIEGLVGEVSRG